MYHAELINSCDGYYTVNTTKKELLQNIMNTPEEIQHIFKDTMEWGVLCKTALI